jgi:hypothetical protein
MTFYDVYSTLSLNPLAANALTSICTLLSCPNDLESVKKALWTKPCRTELAGAFPFDEETGRIYDSLWKAAATENYSIAGRFGRWLFRTICPPAEDEGPQALLRKPAPIVTHEDSPPPVVQAPELEPEPEPEQEDGAEWRQAEEAEEPEVEIEAPASKKPAEPAVTRRAGKKVD